MTPSLSKPAPADGSALAADERRVKRAEAARRHPANARLHAVVDALRRASQLADDFLADHPNERCRCTFCQHVRRRDEDDYDALIYLRRDLSAVSHVAWMYSGMIDNELPHRPEGQKGGRCPDTASPALAAGQGR